MAGFAFYALIGLLLLVPLEMLFLIMVAALARRRELAPKLAVALPGKQERYEWEGIMKLSPGRKPSGGRKSVIAAVIALLLAVIVAVPGLFLVAPSLQLNLSGKPANDTIAVPAAEINETPGRGIFPSLTLPSLNITAPDINVSKIFAPLKASIKAVAVALAVILAAAALLFFIIRRRMLAAVSAAKETAEKPVRKIRKAEPEKEGMEPPKVSGVFSIPGRFRNCLVPAMMLLLLAVIAVLVYLLRSRISGEFLGRLLSFAVSIREFAINYRLYILAGIVILAVSVSLLRIVAKRQQKSA